MRYRLTVLTVALGAVGFCDTLHLRDGRTVQGNFLGGNSRQIRMETGNAVQTFDVTECAGLTFEGAAPATPMAVRPQQYVQPPGLPSGIELTAGTPLTVRVIDAIDSDRNRVGQTFRASMDEPVYINGNPVIPRGSDVVLKLVDARESGRIAGRSTLTLNLLSVRVNGRMVDVNTQSVSEASSSRGARTAKVATGGAAVGAIIGGIAGGGRGAAIGAGAGAGAGAGSQVFFKGQRVRIPSETRLTFVLDVSVRM